MTPVFRFDDAMLLDRIERLFPDTRLVFAATCAQRLQSGYEEYAERTAKRAVSANAKRIVSANSRLAASAMDEVWSGLLSGGWNRRQIQRLAEKCVEVIPTQEEFVPASHQYLEGVASAIGYALSSCLTRASRDVARVARVAYDAAEEIAIKNEDPHSFTTAVEQRLLSDPAVQLELQRQSRDLAELAASDLRHPQVKESALRMRERARAEAWKFP